MTVLTASLPEFAILTVRGKDSAKLLQGQLTCDVMKMDEQHWQLGACCTAKGRMVANFLIARQDDNFYLRLSRDVAEVLKQHLSKYAVFYKTTLEVSNLAVVGTLANDQEAAEPLSTTLVDARGDLETAAADIHWDDDAIRIEWPDGRSELWSEADAEQQPEDDNSNIHSRWLQADMALGLVWVTAESSEKWVPQHAGWGLAGGINFKKGCYTGQEVVARLEYLGKTKKQLTAVQLSNESMTVEIALPMNVSNADGRNVAELIAWYDNAGLAISSVSEKQDGHLQTGEAVILTPPTQS
ncbi:CAF17-like 4Fe-4S cluster assembly/insertion protein YgfZ [Oceanobacter kriegii]|uniref:CAF17-like 4Fe-4S cluster assembly/insertion protein YgfZ n=1 Tax=Oceanobacter kriegii TaxID=64972 RepID=UPI00040D17E2|nr:folate-binding protein YgfZ [Oceanobacter kriegii]